MISPIIGIRLRRLNSKWISNPRQIEPKLYAKFSRIAKKRGVPAETLLNLWLKEKLGQESAAK